MTKTLGLIGTGMIGSALARLAVAAGLEVVLSNSRGPDTIADLATELGARAGTPADAAHAGDIVVATIPLRAYEQLPADALAGKTVIDTMNYYPERDGRVPELETGELTSSSLVQQHLTESRVVKAFNNIDFRRLHTSARPAGAADRSALPVAGDHPAAIQQVTALLDILGYDTVNTGNLAESWRSEPGTPVYVKPYFPATPPAGLGPEESYRWFLETPGIPVSADRVKELIDAAVRLPAGSGRMRLSDD